jgi:hypothetical protein
MPIVLAGHSQGAAHVVRLLRERVAGKPLRPAHCGGLRDRLADLARARPARARPAGVRGREPGGLRGQLVELCRTGRPRGDLEVYRTSLGFDGRARGDSPMLCVNPITGAAGGSAPAAANLGTLKPNVALTSGELVAGGGSRTVRRAGGSC